MADDTGWSGTEDALGMPKQDIIERAEALLALPISERGLDGEAALAMMVPDFVAELKAARAEVERLKSVWTTPSASKAWDGKEPWPGDAVEEAWK